MNRSLRFCLVTTFYPPYHFGGDAVFVHRLAGALAGRGHAVDVVHSIDAHQLAGGRAQRDFREVAGVRRLPLATRWPTLAALASHQLGSPGPYRAALREVLDGGRYDVVHFHNISLVGGPEVLTYGTAVKLYTTHEYWLVCPTHVLFRFDHRACEEKRCLECTLRARRPPQLWRATGAVSRGLAAIDRLLIPSRFALERHRAEGIRAPMEVFPSFVPVPPTLPDRAGATQDFLYAGRLERLKGLQDVIPLFRALPAARLLIAGTGAFETELRRVAEGVPNVEFLGQVHPSRVAELYRAARAAIVPSLCYEVFPLAPVEAMAQGVPVLGRRIGAVTEVVEESGGGVLFDTSAACLEALRRLLDDTDAARAMGAAGRRHALAHWTESAHLDRYFRLIGQLLERQDDRRRR